MTSWKLSKVAAIILLWNGPQARVFDLKRSVSLYEPCKGGKDKGEMDLAHT